MEGKQVSWDVTGKEREEQGTSYCCETKGPVFTSPDYEHTFPNITVCVCLCVCSEESDALTHCLSKHFDALLGLCAQKVKEDD